jgi:hypothetical protein
MHTAYEEEELRRESEWAVERWHKEEDVGGVLQVARLLTLKRRGGDGSSQPMLDVTDTISECVVLWYDLGDWAD